MPSAPPPASARSARRPAHRTSRAPAAAPSAETSHRKHDSMAVPRCGASDPRRLPPHTASKTEEHTSELQSPCNLVCRLLLEKKKKKKKMTSSLRISTELILINVCRPCKIRIM